jgi:cell division transport system permease protein
MIDGLSFPSAQRDILGSAGFGSVTTWIIAAMTFVIVLVAAGGLMVTQASRTLERAIESRFTLVVPDGGGDVEAIAGRLRKVEGVSGVEAVSEQDLRRTLGQWLGPVADSSELPVPAMIDFNLARVSDLPRVKRELLHFTLYSAINSHSDEVAPVVQSLRGLQWTALLLVLLLAIAAGAAVVLSARSALAGHRSTIEVLHGIGATDMQVTRLFVRRIAFETLIGSTAGAIAAGMAISVIASTALWLSDFGAMALRMTDIILLCLTPLVLTLAATLAVRAAILSALEREL